MDASRYRPYIVVGLGTNQSQSPAGAISLMSFLNSPEQRVLEIAQKEIQQGEAFVRKQEALKAYKKATLMHKGSSQAKMWGTDEGAAIRAAISTLETLQKEANGLIYQLTKGDDKTGHSLAYFTETVFEIIKGKRDTGSFVDFPRALEALKNLKDDHTFTKSEIEKMEQEEQDRLKGVKLEDTLVFDDTMDEDFEVYFDAETGDQYKVPVELVRDFSRAELIGNKND